MMLLPFDALLIDLSQKQQRLPEGLYWTYDAIKKIHQLTIADDLFLEKPLVILNDTQDNVKHVEILIGKNAKLMIVEYYGLGNYEEQIKLDLTIGEAATVEWVKYQNRSLQSLHEAKTRIFPEKKSTLSYYQLTLGAKKSQDCLDIPLHAEEANVVLKGVYLPISSQQLVTDIVLHHTVDHCQSDLLYKGIVGEKAEAIFQAKTVIYEKTKQNSGYQANHNLLLGNNSQVDAKPVLEIYADDVKCSHGCTVGGLDPEKIFYLQARGVAKNDALQLLMRGFVEETLEKISHPALFEFLKAAQLEKLNALIEASE